MDRTGTGAGGAVRWYVVGSVMLSVASLAGAHALEWLARSGRIALVAESTHQAPARARLAASGDIDPLPTGSIAPTTVMIRLH